MKEITTIQFSENEEQALSTLANIECTNVACANCPFAVKELLDAQNGIEVFAGCILTDISSICDKFKIPREEIEHYGNH